MGKDIDELLKEVNDIEVPNSISCFTDEILDSLPEKNKKRKVLDLKKAAVAAILIITTGVGVSYACPSFAEAVPILKDVVSFLKDNKVISDKSLKYTKEIKQVVRDKGITLEIQKAMLTDSSLKIFYTVETEKHMEWGAKVNYSDLYIDGKKVDKGNEKNDSIKISKDGEVEKYACITTLDVSRLNLKNEFDVKWHIKSIHLNDGDWNVVFKADKNEISKETYIFKPNYLRECEGVKTTFQKIVVSPIETAITVKLDEDSLFKAYEKIGVTMAKLEGKEKMEQEQVEDMMDLHDKTVFKSFSHIVIDDKGNNLAGIDSNQSDNDCRTSTHFLKGIKEKPKSLTFIPFERLRGDYNKYINTINIGNIDEIKKNNKIKISKDVILVIDEIERNGSKIKINYSFEGKYYSVGERMAQVKLIDNKDNEAAYRITPGYKNIAYWDIDGSKDNKYTTEYEIHEKNSYRLEIINSSDRYKINENEAFTIQLEN